MTQQVVHARINFPNAASFADASSIGLTFEATGSDASLTMSEVDTAIEGFLNGLTGAQVASVASYLSPDISRAAGAIQVLYTDVTDHLDGSNAGGPFRSYNSTLAAAGVASPMPPGICCTVGYRAAYGSDIEHGPSVTLPSSEAAIDQGAPATHLGSSRPRARDRGRFYLGPLNVGAFEIHTGGGQGGQFTGPFKADMTEAVNNLLEAKNPGAHDQFQVVIWSRRAATVKTTSFYYVDDSASYQRRRADENTNRVHNWVTVT